MRRSLQARRRVAAVLSLTVGLLVLVHASSSSGDLRSREQELQQSISADDGRIQQYEGRLSDLRSRMNALESSLAVQERLLVRIRDELAAARTRLASLRADLVRDRKLLAAQLVSQYESPTPDLVGVVLNADGFAELLDRVDQLRAIANQNVAAVKRVTDVKAEVRAQTARLADAETRQQRVTSAVLVERDQVADLQLAVLEREQVAVRDRKRRRAELTHVRKQLAILQARAAAAQRASFASSGVPPSGGAGLAPSGAYGFFPAPGTNYSVGQEPQIAARLNALGKALHLHLIGISGYRSPQHSVEVGGFADDPHTRGEASDTPGVEGVPESTLLHFGLTRPFPGPAEADHIQLA